MKSYKAYNPTEINGIANKFLAGEFVTLEELKIWYSYKTAVKTEIDNCQHYLKMAEKNRGDKPKSEITIEIEKEHQTAQEELTWIRSIKTFPLLDFCKYYELQWDYNMCEDAPSLIMAKRVIDGATETEQDLIREILEESETLKTINHYRNLTTPVSLRSWTFNFNPGNKYYASETAMDGTHLYNGREHYVYIQSECKQHRWGETYWISIDCDNSLYSLPIIKDFKNYDFKVGGFYKITCKDTIYYGANKKKYVMSIEESNEEEFMSKGLHEYATRW